MVNARSGFRFFTDSAPSTKEDAPRFFRVDNSCPNFKSFLGAVFVSSDGLGSRARFRKPAEELLPAGLRGLFTIWFPLFSTFSERGQGLPPTTKAAMLPHEEKKRKGHW